jgi:hypothetical protein
MSDTQKLPSLEEAKTILSECHLVINKDRAFGDAEYYWELPDGDRKLIAEGYYGGGDANVHFLNHSINFRDDQARELRDSYSTKSVIYNDSSGE